MLCLACGGGGADPAEEPPAHDEAKPPSQPVMTVPTVTGGDGKGTVALAFDGVGKLHRKFFSEPAVVGPMADAVSRCLTGEAVVRISWDDDVRIGRIALETRGGALACGAVAGPDGVELTGLEPVGRALAAYRDAVAAAFDFRVASFRAELVLSGSPTCRLRIGGNYPPDGSRWDRCVELDGRRVCAAGGSEGLTRLNLPEPGDQARLVACFGG